MKTPLKALFVKVLIFLLLVGMYIAIGTKDLYVDVINPDGINWHNRTQSFVEALNNSKYSDTFQVYHPGITLMWISGPVLNIFHNPQQNEIKANFLERDYYAKLSLVVFSAVIFLITFIVLWKLVSFNYASFFSILFMLEPFELGMRRLYHLDYLMTILIFLSILLLIYFNYKTQRWFLLPLSGMFLAMAILTKSTAIIVLPAIPFIFLLGNSVLYKKALALLIFLLSLVVFIYAFFPALWKDPIKSFPKYYEKISLGISDIGIAGKKEMGVSGKGDSITLDDTLKDKDENFYFVSLFMRYSTLGGILFVISLGIYLYYCLKGFILILYRSIRSKRMQTLFEYPPESWISFWSIGIASAILISLTFAVKKSDRYEILVFPFLLTLTAFFLQRFNRWLAFGTLVIYIAFVSSELYKIHPYYIAYSNPPLGGIQTRLYALNDDPFGIGSYEAFQIVMDDMLRDEYSGYYTISGSKSIKAISVGSRFSRFPSCVTDYVIAYSLWDQPTYTCNQKYTQIGNVNIAGFDYWNVYKRLYKKHESNYE